jgi:hypothetical protein
LCQNFIFDARGDKGKGEGKGEVENNLLLEILIFFDHLNSPNPYLSRDIAKKPTELAAFSS